jgi:hypothetical protein
MDSPESKLKLDSKWAVVIIFTLGPGEILAK